MVFLAPLTLLGLALAALPVAIHLLVRQRGKRLDFPTLRFLRETPSFRLRPRYIQQPLLLALRLAALLLLVAGLARPLVYPGANRARTTHVILLDASLSMNARGRIEAAHEQARNIINKLNAGDRAALVAFSSDAVLLAPPTTDRRVLSQILERYQPESSRADYAVGLDFAGELLQHEPPGRAEIDVVSDFQQSNLEDQRPFTVNKIPARIVAFPVGTMLERNAFLIDEAVNTSKRGLELSATEIISSADGQSATRRLWTLDAPNNSRSDLEWRVEANNQITGRFTVVSPDDFDADDVKFFAFTVPRPRRILLINDGSDASLYLRAAFESIAAVGDKEAPATLDERRALPADASELKAYSHVVMTLHGAPHAGELNVINDYSQSGGIVWLCLARDADGAAWSAAAQTEAGRALPFSTLTRINGDHLSLVATDQDALPLRSMTERSLDALRAVRVRAGYLVTPRDNVATLMRWNEGSAPAFVASKVGAGAMLLLATSMERTASDLGQSAALPALASSLWRVAELAREPLSQTIGEPVRLSLAPETVINVTDTNGNAIITRARDLIASPSTIFRKPGLYRLAWGSEAKFLALNAPIAESVRTLAGANEIKEHFPDGESAGEAGNAVRWRDAAERRGNVWRYFLAAALLMLVAELFVARRLSGRSRAPLNDLL